MNSPSVENYTLGRGRLLFNRKDTDGNFLGLKDLGNCPSFSISIDVEKQEHFSSRTGLKTKDKTVITGMNPKSTITLDEISADNVAMIFMASMTKVTQVASSSNTKTITSAQQGQYFELDEVFIDPTEANISVTSDAGGTTHVMGTDFTIEDKSGKIYIMVGGGIADDTDLEVTFNTLDKTFYRLNAFDESSVEGELQFISDVAVGNDQIVKIWSVSITPAGEFGLISDDWNSMEFEVEINKDEAYHPLFPFMEVIIPE